METIEDHKMSLTDHLMELRKRLVRSVIILLVGFGACYYYKDFIFDIVTRPLVRVLPQKSYLIYTGLTEAFEVSIFCIADHHLSLNYLSNMEIHLTGAAFEGKKICAAFCIFLYITLCQWCFVRLFCSTTSGL
jgi:hypothetical protein